MSFFNNECHGGGASQKVTQTIYIKQLIIMGSPGNYDVRYTPTLFQKVKSALGFYPKPEEIVAAVRHDMLGEKQ